MDVLIEKIPIGFTGVDPSGALTLFSIFDYFQKAAIRHAEELGVGRVKMAQQNQVWILSRMTVLVERRPLLDEELTLHTWPCGFEKLFAVRDYVFSAAGKRIVRSRSFWLLVDIEKRRPLRPQELAIQLPCIEDNAFAESPRALVSHNDLAFVGERTANYSDIDFNAHVNNARYIQWIQDFVDADKLMNAGKLRLDINYLSEIKIAETISFLMAVLSGESPSDNIVWPLLYALEGRKRSDGQAAFRAELRMTNKDPV
ncbi:MAG: acyl-ACP thioesterase [Spirochaetaceae bacterium]|jgi:acyl-ACP thioesterase|nr:acyl-ACP thioesterase [Spirochaetaceae bacterium]